MQRIATSVLRALLFFLLLLGTGAAVSAQAPGSDQLPADHPPVQKTPENVLPEVPEGSGTGEKGLSWTVPESWQAEEPSSPMRRAQYRVPGEAGDGQCIVYYFGPGQGGGAQANVDRWIGQFTQPDGRPSSEVAKVESLEVGGLKVLTLEVTGTYQGGMTMRGPQQGAQEGSMMLAAIAEGPDANWFFKLTGPEKTLAGHREGFAALVASLRPGE